MGPGPKVAWPAPLGRGPRASSRVQVAAAQGVDDVGFLADLIGLDTAYEILDTMYKQSRDRLHAPVPVFRQMITAGLLGSAPERTSSHSSPPAIRAVFTTSA